MSDFIDADKLAGLLSAEDGETFPFLHTITVVDRVISVDKPELIQNNIKTETVTLNLDSEWDGLSTVINIGNERPVSVIWSGEPVVIPAELMTNVGSLDVSVVGYGGDGGVRAVTKQAESIFNVVASGFVEGDEAIPDPTTILGRLIEAADNANKAADRFNQVSDDIEGIAPAIEKVQTSEKNSKQSETNAAASAESAAQSASTAAASAEAAKASEANAASSAASASEASMAAKASETNAALSASAASQSASQAQSSATAAQQAVDGFGLEIGTTTTGEPGTDAAVSIAKQGTKYVADFTIPQGQKGDKGDRGDKGDGLQISHVASDVGSLPTSDVAEGTMAMVNGVLYAWDGSQWSEQGDIAGGSNLDEYYTKEESDSRYAQAENVYDKTTADSTFAKKTDIVDAYTKTESDEKYATLADTYDKTTADSTFVNQSSVIDVAHGGTGKTTAQAANNALFGYDMPISDEVADATKMFAQLAAPSDDNGAVGTYTASQLWAYMMAQITAQWPDIGGSAKVASQEVTFQAALFADTTTVQMSGLTLGDVNVIAPKNLEDNLTIVSAASPRISDHADDESIPADTLQCTVTETPTGDMQFIMLCFETESEADATA